MLLGVVLFLLLLHPKAFGAGKLREARVVSRGCGGDGRELTNDESRCVGRWGLFVCA
jgi:hypothetical protein